MSRPYQSAPVASPHMPPGIPFIVANEAAERFSFYGMRGILVVFMTKFLLDSQGQPAPMTDVDARSYFHLFVASAYFFPLIGAVVSDVFLGKYLTIVSVSLLYCLGHLALAVDDTRVGLAIGLGLIALGSGGIKPCVSAHVGDQFGETNQHLIEKVFGWFYFSINLGAFLSTLLTPYLLQKFPAQLGEWSGNSEVLGIPIARLGPHLAFGVPGLLMLIATWVFWLGRYRYVHIPPRGWDAVRSAFTGEGGRVLLRLAPIYLCVSMFWALFDQTGSAWVQQAEKMDRNWLGINWLASHIQAANPILILLYIPLFSYIVYPALGKVIQLTPLRKIGIGLFITTLSFMITAFIEHWIAAGETPKIAWQLLAYLVITSAEVMVSITCLEFSYTQAPREMKSFVMAVFLLSVSLGNQFTSLVNHLISNPDGTQKLSGPAYYWFFAGAMLATSLVFVFIAVRYRGKVYLQEEQPASGDTSAKRPSTA